MSRRSRSGTIDTDAEVAALALPQLEAEIARVQTRLQLAGSTRLAKAFFKRLIWLEAVREATYSIPAPLRRFGRQD